MESLITSEALAVGLWVSCLFVLDAQDPLQCEIRNPGSQYNVTQVPFDAEFSCTSVYHTVCKMTLPLFNISYIVDKIAGVSIQDHFQLQ